MQSKQTDESSAPSKSGDHFPDPLAPLHLLANRDPLAAWCRWPLLRWMALGLLGLALVLLLSACGTTRLPPSAPAAPPVSLVQPCRAPEPITDGSAETLLTSWVQAMRLYSRCAQDKDDLVRWINTQR